MTQPADGPVFLVGVDPYALRACAANDIEAVLLYSGYMRDTGLPDLPECVTPVFAENNLDIETVLAALHRHGYGDVKPAGVLSNNEFGVTAAAVLASVFGCESLKPQTAIAMRDKTVQKQLIRQAGIPTADLVVIEDIHHLPMDFELPFPHGVLKPVAGGSTAMTTVIRSLGDLESASAQYRQQRSASRTFALERFVRGEEWFVDGYVTDGTPTFWSLGAYDEPCLTMLESEHTLVMRRFDPTDDADRFARARPVIEAALACLGYRHGVFHMELFHDLDSGDLSFGECAARRGGCFVQEEVQFKFGVDLAEAALFCAIGRDPAQQPSVRPEVIGTALFPPIKGTLLDGPTAAEMVGLDGVRFARMDMPLGSTPGSRNNSITHQGSVLLATRSVPEFDAKVREVHHWFAERTTVLPPGLHRGELKTWQREVWPDRDFGNPLFHPPAG